MEPRDRAAEAVTATFRVRVAAACALLVGIAFVQDPGFLVADTKFDLVGAPGEFLARSLHLWDGQGAFGQLQNQAYGYLWPMGPFFLAGDAVGIPGWAIQRLWLALVLVVACAGSARLTRALGVRSDLACILAGFAFALSPRMLSTLGPISIEAWPSALAPWVLLPLVLGSTSGSPRRAAAWSALAVAMVGGVNAAATFAVIPLGVVWLLTRTPGPRRRALMIWWPVFTALGTLWWLVPLFVMGSYSPPFLDYIETTSVTTFPTTLFDVVRGTSNWVPYIDSEARAGNDLLRESYLALNSGVLLLLGFAGLLDRRTPHRAFLVLGLLVGVLMVAAGHSGSVQGWFAEPIRDLLDGVLAPLRNVHKFDVVVRLPLVVGMAFVLDRVLSGAAVDSDDRGAPMVPDGSVPWLTRVNRVAVVGMALVAVVGAALPALQGRIYPSGALFAVPDYWADTADWLADNSGEGTALLIPGSGFAEYVWGTPNDEPMQYLAGSRWAVRNVIPLVPAGGIRMLDGIEARLAQGRGSAGLTESLRRAGIKHLVVRNDLARSNDLPDTVLVHQALAQSPGIGAVASFGPDVGGAGHLEIDGQRVLVNGGWQTVTPAVEVFEVDGAAHAVSSSAPPLVVAGPEDLADLTDLDVLGGEPVLLAANATAELASRTSRLVLTDGLRARERWFARTHDGASAVLLPGAERRSGNPTRDYLIDEDDRWSTTGRLSGAAAVAASSSASDAGEFGGSRRGESAIAAVDNARRTEWVSGLGRPGRAWWSVTFESPTAPTMVRLVGGESAAENQEVRVVTDEGRSDPVQLGPGETRVVALDESETATLRIEDVQASTTRPLAIAEVAVPGLSIQRSLMLPRLPQEWGSPHQIVLRTDSDPRTGCVEIADDVRCVPARAYPAEETTVLDRTMVLGETTAYQAELTVRPVAGRPLVRRLLRDQFLGVNTSTTAVADVRASGLAAVDGRLGTAWLADSDDLRPTLSLSWLDEREVSGLTLSVDPDTPARAPVEVTIIWPGGRTSVPVRDGRVTFPPITVDQLRIQVERAEAVTNLGFDAQPSSLLIGIGEVQVLGVPYAPLTFSSADVTYPCGQGPQVLVNGVRHDTEVVGAPAELAQGLQGTARLCERDDSDHDADPEVVLRTGENVVRAEARGGFAVDTVVLSRSGVPPVPSVTPSGLEPDGPVTRTLAVAPDDVVVAMRENSNRGWEATTGGARLEPVVLDGWQQGWLLPAGFTGDSVTARFTPDPLYRGGLLAGGIALLGLLVVVGVLLRRHGPDPPSLLDRRVPTYVLVPMLVMALGILAGWIGLLVGLLAAGGTVILLRRAQEAAPYVVGALCLAAALDYAITPWGSATGWAGNDRWPHYLVLVALAASVTSLVVDRRPRRGL